MIDGRYLDFDTNLLLSDTLDVLGDAGRNLSRPPHARRALLRASTTTPPRPTGLRSGRSASAASS